MASANGTVVATYNQIGVLVVRSTNPDFVTDVAGAGVESVASTAGLGTALEESETVEVSRPRRRTSPPTRPRSPSTVSSGTCR